MANIFDEFQCLKKVRFFNVEKNKNAPVPGGWWGLVGAEIKNVLKTMRQTA